jgi:predicted dehydrogenase
MGNGAQTGMKSIDVTIVGGGMITNDLILPTAYLLQRTGMVGNIHVCALNTPPLKALNENEVFAQFFPGQGFTPHPVLDESPAKTFPDLYRQVLAAMPSRQVVFVAMPDQLHYEVVMEALRNNQHVMCVKPLVLSFDQAETIG